MIPVEWPARKCREVVWHGDIAHSCEVIDLHPGPCASTSFAESVQRRDAFEAANPTWMTDMKPEGGVFE